MTYQALHSALEQLHIPQERKYHSIQASEGEFIYRWVRQRKLVNTLEVGLADGYSATCIMTGHQEANGSHTCIDPFQQSLFDGGGLQNLALLGYRDRLQFHETYSHHTLPQLHEQAKTFDFVFIDGGHLYEEVFLDFYYADLLIAPGGFVLLHDAWMRSTQMVASYIRKNRKDYRQVRKAGRNLVLFEKIANPKPRPFYHFREFYTLRGIFSQNLIAWLIRTGHIERFLKK